MSGNSAFELVGERGWRRGLRNMLQSELAHWWKTNMWWIQCIIWIGVVGFLLSTVLFAGVDIAFEDAVIVYSVFAGLFPSVGVVIILQDAIVGDRQNGTAAWVLSKPVSRSSFIVSKLMAHSLGVFATMVLAPGLVAYVLFSLSGQADFSILQFGTALGGIFLSQLFFLTLTLMLGTFFKGRGPVIGIPLGVLFMQQNLIGMVQPLKYVLPWTLVIPPGGGSEALVPAMLLGQPAPSTLQIGLISLEIIIFTVVALWRFQQEEF